MRPKDKRICSFNLTKRCYADLEKSAKDAGLSTSKFIEEFLYAQYMTTPRTNINQHLTKIEHIAGLPEFNGDTNYGKEIKFSVEQIRLNFQKII